METINISDIKIALTLKISALDTTKDRVMITRLYETLTGVAIGKRNPDNPDEVSITDKSHKWPWLKDKA